MKHLSPRRWLGYAGLGLGLYLLFLLVFAPADYLARAIAQASGRAITIQQPAGTLWRGSGTLTIATASAQPFGQIRWTLQPWKLITGSLVAHLEFTGTDIEARASAELGLRRHRLRDVLATAPATIAGELVPLAQAMGLNGRLRLNAASIEIGKDALAGSAELLWENAASQLLPANPAGSYRFLFSGEAKRLDLTVTTTEGALEIAAQGHWNALDDGVLKLQGTLAARAPQLEPFLAAIGTPQADGRRAFTYDLKLPPLRTEALFP
jgi:general secretion pathway protein N